ncbi:CarboxypepD_reg-like domain-containing protein [Paenimyroides ummariense]|uniref:CarboxypepD_reg-like domain-containing protein n=1 Tax=Paenimyroides ummariense TaxID=913024 RepID=A0A1I4WMG1_9FLAO|nr:carboxypeptidase-like regulatory domain-containing protein [Paenimyroides ummariense]SFN14657.1 CarboxypepD_reg-like domain-containing protein [Paenimyroides ummariense]
MKHFYVLICCFLSVFTNAQTIKGVVVSADTGKPVEAASVFLDNTTIATETDAKGNFQINIPANNKNQLVVSAFAYEYFLVSDPGSTTDLKIRLKPEETVLQELVIDKNVFTRKQMLKAFKHFFIGNTKNAKRTKIVNENDLYFYFDTKTNQLSAHSDKPIVINNENLGYTIKFHLESFQVQFNYQTLDPKNYMNSNYFGYSLFSENEKSNKKIVANRNETYNNSSAAFFSDLTTANLENSDYLLAVNGLGVPVEEYFKVEPENDGYKLCIIKKPTRKRPDLSGVVIKGGNLNSKLQKDTAEIEVPFVVFNKETKEQSQLYFQQNCVLIQKGGHLVNPNDVYFSGFFADLKTADMLPIDFITERKVIVPKKAENILDDKEYVAFETAAAAFYGSNEYMEYSVVKRQFTTLLKEENEAFANDNFESWIKENLSRTKFETAEQAITMFKKRNELHDAIKERENDFLTKEQAFAKKYGNQFNDIFYKNVVAKILKRGFHKP